MPDDNRISDLVMRAEEEKRNGRAPDVAALCAGDPILMAEVRRRLHALGEIDRMLDTRPADPPPAHPALPAGYEFVRELGRGGMGVVYLARDEKGYAVAVKISHASDPARLDYLKREFTRSPTYGTKTSSPSTGRCRTGRTGSA